MRVVARADVGKVAKSPKCGLCASGSECLLVARRTSSRPLRRENCVRTPDVRVFCGPWASTGISCTYLIYLVACLLREERSSTPVGGRRELPHKLRGATRHRDLTTSPGDASDGFVRVAQGNGHVVCKFSAGSGGQIGWRTWFASTICTRASSLRTAAFFSSSHHRPGS